MKSAKTLLFALAALLVADAVDAQIAFRSAAQAFSASGTAASTISFVAAGTQVAGTGASITPGIPGGTLANDFAVLIVAGRPTDTSEPTVPAGWTFRSSSLREVGANDLKLMTFYRVLQGGDTNPSITLPGTWTAGGMSGQIAVWRGVDTTTPFDLADVTGNAAANNTLTPPPITTVTNGAWAVSAVASGDDNNLNVNPANGFTARMFGANYDTAVGVDHAIGLADLYQPSAGLVTMPGWEQNSSGGDPWVSITFALRPATPPATNLVINLPAGTVAGDVMVAGVTYRPCSSTSGAACTTAITPPAGWTAIGTTINQTTGAGAGGFGHRLSMYYRVATGAEPAAYTWAIGGTPVHAGAAGGILAFSGVNQLNPVVANQGVATASSSTHIAPQIDTTGTVNTMLVHAFTINSSGAWTPPGGSTERVDVSSLTPNNALGLTIGINTEPFAAAGLTGTRTSTFAGPPVDTGATYMLALRPATAQANHYSITHGGSGVACADHTITITAHNNTHTATDAGQATITLSTTNAKGSWVSIVSGGGTLTDTTAGDGIAQYTFAAGSSSVQLSFRYANLAATSETFGFNVTDGVVTETSGVAIAADDPNFTMAQAGFVFRNITDASTTIPTQLSAKNSDTGFNAKTLRIAAVRTDTNGACAGVFASATRTVDIGAECNNPATCAALQMVLNGTALATSADNGGAGASAYTGVSLTFDANSESAIVLNYPDAGQMSLHARYDLDPLVAGYEMIGASNAFVVRPLGFAFTGITHGTDHTSAAGYTAGLNFSMTVAAYRWAAGEDADNNGIPDAGVNLTDNGITPNFAATVTVAPEAGTSLPGVALGAVSRGVTCASAGTVAMTGGTATIADWCYSEVGNVRFQATVTGYIAGGVDIQGNTGHDGTGGGATAGRVGRFKPRQFGVSGVPTIQNRAVLACGGTFTYMGEGLDLAFTLEAQNAQNARTFNYHALYAKHDPTAGGTNDPKAAFVLGAASGATALTTRLSAVYAGTTPAWSQGRLTIADPNDVRVLVARATPDAPDGPYAATLFGVAPTDSDGVLMVAPYDLNADGVAGNERKSLGVSTELRFGRLRMENAMGSERLAISVPIRVEYWAGKGFTTNTLDSCTTIGRDQIAMDFTPVSNLTACETAITTASVAFASGVGSLTLSAPGAGNNGTVLLTPQLRSTVAGSYCPGPTVITSSALKSYLLGRWNDASNPDADANTSYDDNPAARVAFGIYGSQPSKYIYLRENY